MWPWRDTNCNVTFIITRIDRIMGRAIPSDYIGTGINSDIRLDDYVRCSRCGFINKLSRDIRARRGSRAGWGMIYVRQYKDTIIESAIVLDSDTTPTTPPTNRIVLETGETFFTEDGQAMVLES